MKSKRLLTTSIAVASMLLWSTMAFGETSNENRLISAPVDSGSYMESVHQSHYNSYKGVIKAIEDSKNVQGSKIVQVESDNGDTAYFLVSQDTYFVNNKDMKVGEKIIGYYDATRPMIMIYPPQYPVDVVAIGDVKTNIKVDLFDENLVSADNQLKINVDKSTTVVTKDEKNYVGSLENKKLAVLYNTATKSIPAQTSPEKIVVIGNESGNDVNAPVNNSNSLSKGMAKYLIQIINRFLM